MPYKTLLQRVQPFESEGFSFYRIDSQHNDFPLFCDFFARQILEHPSQAQATKTHAELAQGVGLSEAALQDDAVIVVCKKDNAIVGCVRLALDTPAHPLPFEDSVEVDLNPVREQGTIMEISRLAVAPEHRTNAIVLQGLFSWCNNVALACDIDFVVAVAFPYVVPLYRRLAYEIIFPKEHPKFSVTMPNGFSMHPVALNFSGALAHRREEFEAKTKRLAFLDPVLKEEAYARVDARMHDFETTKPLQRGLDGLRQALVEQGLAKVQDSLSRCTYR